ncbi:MAG: hypothetical protein HY326_13150 [Chloroflexi bacterium]|nr:hypothetical protein [Chloroflexota bacterium]
MNAILLSHNWQLFLDDYLVERETGITRRLHQPAKQGLVIPADQPWETDTLFLQPVFDGERFHAIYQVKWPDPRIPALHAPGKPLDQGDMTFAYEYAYATSTDGIHWDKPNLGLTEVPILRRNGPEYEIVGSTRRNNCGIPIDFVQDLAAYGNVSDPEKRFLIRLRNAPGTLESLVKGHFRKQKGPLFFSPVFPDFVSDPLWQEKLIPIDGQLAPRGFDNFSGWDEKNGEWVAFMQGTGPGGRWFPSRDIARHATKDFQHWSARSVLLPDADDPHTQEHFDEFMEITVVWNEDLWLGYMAVFHSDRTDFAYTPPFVKEPDLIFRYDLPRYATRKGTADLQLVTSRDGGNTWKRVAGRQVWLPHGTAEGSFDRLAYKGIPIRLGDMNYFYYTARDGDHLAFTHDGSPYYHNRLPRWQIALATQTWNRQVSMSTGTFPSILYTKPLIFNGTELRLNADGSRGEIRVELTRAEKREIADIHTEPVIPGFSFQDCRPILDNATAQRVGWAQGGDLAAFAGQSIRLRFYIRNADLYGFQIC